MRGSRVTIKDLPSSTTIWRIGIIFHRPQDSRAGKRVHELENCPIGTFLRSYQKSNNYTSTMSSGDT